LALVNGPELVFLDEMTTGLDPGARRVAWGLIDDIRARGTTVVLVTHFMDEAEHLCDRVAVLKAGHVVACDTPAGLIAANDSEATVTFTTDATALDWLPCVPGVTGDHRLQRSSLTSSADRARRHPQTDDSLDGRIEDPGWAPSTEAGTTALVPVACVARRSKQRDAVRSAMIEPQTRHCPRSCTRDISPC
jgi:ABC-type multidrug transport system ATPase subunit